jgi:hypothetical protein
VSDESHDTRDQRASVAQAAQMLGITEGAVRKRVERGKLRAEHDGAGRLIVYLDATTTDATRDTTHDRPRQSRSDRYTRSLEDQVEYLRQQLDQEREARTEEKRRHDELMARLTQANAALAARIPEQLEAPLTVEEEPEVAEPQSDTAGPQTAPRQPERVTLRGLRRRAASRWRRVFGQ